MADQPKLDGIWENMPGSSKSKVSDLCHFSPFVLKFIRYSAKSPFIFLGLNYIPKASRLFTHSYWALRISCKNSLATNQGSSK
jgi:hypothetical protein